MNRILWAAPLALLALFVLRPAPAVASLHICNKTQHSVAFAVGTMFSDGGDCEMDCTVHSKGWWNVKPGACKTPIGGALDISGDVLYYYYAEDSDGATWTGSLSFCVDPQNAFDFDDDANANCTGTHKSFRLIKNGMKTDYTLNLTP